MVTDAIIFDFDDTLVATNVLFEQVREQFLSAMSDLGFTDREELALYLNQADIDNVLSAGFMAKDCFPRAMGQTYAYFMSKAGRSVDQAEKLRLEKIGWQVYNAQAQYLPGALDLLSWLQGRARLFLLTQGDLEIQQRRLKDSGVLAYFDNYRIVINKEEATYREFITDMQIDVNCSWMVGNSIRADVNPALKVGLRAVHYQLPAWDFEHEEPYGQHYSITDLADLKELIAI